MKKIALAAAASAVIATSAMAADITLQATYNLIAPIALSQNTELSFGDVSGAAGSQCVLDRAGTATGAGCLGGSVAAGSVKITGAADAAITLNVVGSSANNVTFTPDFDGTINSLTGGDLDIAIGGTLDIAAGASGSSLDYTVTVDYN